MTKVLEKVTTPKCELRWACISGPGKEDLMGKLKYKVDVVLDPENATHKAFMDKIDDFWLEHKPKGYKLKSKVYKAETRKTDEVDEDGEPVREETGKYIATFKTDVTWPDGKAKTIRVYNAKNVQVLLGKKEIGNGTIGRVGGAIDIYTSKTKEAGVTAYLNEVQIVKLEERDIASSFDLDDDEDGWTGDDFEGDEVTDNPASTPRL